MITEFHAMCMDNHPSSDLYTAERSSFMSHDLGGTTFQVNRRRRSKAITCIASPLNASNFSVDDTFLTTTFETATNVLKSAFVQQGEKEILEDGQNNFEVPLTLFLSNLMFTRSRRTKYVPSESMTMEVSPRDMHKTMDVVSQALQRHSKD